MKKLTILTAILITTMSFAQVPNYVPTNGLVGWWPFNGNANDESGNGNNGTVNGATLTTDRNGVANSAYSFDGIISSIQTNNSTHPLNDYNITYSFWIYCNNLSQDRSLISVGLSGGGVNNRSGVHKYIGGNLGFVVNGPDYSSSYVPILNEWHHVVFTKNNLQIIVFVDGIAYDNGFLTGPLNVQNNTINFGWNGNNSNNSGEHFSGNIDDIGIWNRALTGIEIATLFEGCNLNITTQPQDQTVTTSVGTVNFSATSIGANPLYQWQTNIGLGFQNLSNAGQYSGATSSTMNVSNLSMTNNNQVFRCVINDAGCTDTTTIATLTIIDDASVVETTLPLLSISPNPTAGDFNIAGLELYNNISSMRVSDVNGKLVKELDPTASKFTLGTVKPGVYFLTITAGNKQEVIKLIKD